MYIRDKSRRILTGTAAVALLAGCASNEKFVTPDSPALNQNSTLAAQPTLGRSFELLRSMSVLPVAMLPSLHPSAASQPGSDIKGPVHAFISDANNNVVYALNTQGKIVGRLKGFLEPQGIAVDKSHNLYVADSSNSRVQVYAPPYTGKPKTLNDPGFFPSDVAIDASGNVAVTNVESTSLGGGNVVFYGKGATTPTNTIYGGGGYSYAFLFCAFDAHGNLFTDYRIINDGVGIGEIIGGVQGSSLSGLAFDSIEPGGIQVSTQGHIAIIDEGAKAINSYAPPPNFGSPIATTPLSGADDPMGFAFTSTNKIALVADAGLNTASLFSFPAGGKPEQSFKLPAGGMAVGAAENPPAIP